MKSYETERREEMTESAPPVEEGDIQEEEVLREDDSGNGTLNSTDSELLIPEGKVVERPQPEQSPGLKFPLPSREQLVQWAPFWGVILLGAVLRFWGLGDKPLHHDESLHAYFSWQLLLNVASYHYDPLLHGPFQFHFIALIYKICQLLGVSDNGINTFTVRILAATLGTVIVGLPYFLRDYLGKVGAWIASFLLAISPSMVYFSRFAREDIYMACFTLLLVVAIARYVRTRQMRWIIIAALALSLSYATKEATFLTVAIFGSFFAGLLAWELGLKWPLRSRFPEDSAIASFLPRSFAPVTLLAFLAVAGVGAKFFFAWIKTTSVYVSDPKNSGVSDVFVQGLKDKTVAVVPYIGIALGLFVLGILAREMFGRLPPPGRRGLAARVDPRYQRMLDTVLTMPWTHWFFAILVAWTVFLVLFTALFTNIRAGIGDGIWQGFYYWLQQQQVARGGQPWYYYFLLIPLYEQVGVVFGLIGLVRCLVQPTRFRLFLAYWFVGNVFLYSWASEKMPWLSIHMTMPMMLLAAVSLEPVVLTLYKLVKNWLARRAEAKAKDSAGTNGHTSPTWVHEARPKVGVFAGSTAVVGFVAAVLLLLPTLHNMYEVAYVHPADGPHEMMVYVQTTTDVNIVMAKVDALDQKLYGGKHLLPIGLMGDATWPFAWYLRDYTTVCFDFPTAYCPVPANQIPVIISGGDNLYAAQTNYAGVGKNYLFHQYHMRSWWDEGYKPPPCVPSRTDDCAGQPTWGGVGAGLWLTYGDNPPPNGKFNLGLAAQHIWQWWWDRRAIGATDGSYDMGLFIRKDLGVTP